MRCSIKVKKTVTEYFADMPDLPSCISIGSHVVEVTVHEISEAIAFHTLGLHEPILAVPPQARK